MFNKVGLVAFLDAPLLGHGVASFYSLFIPYSETLRLGTDLWTDNSNNFYLGLLVECGVFGALLLIFGLQGIRLRENPCKFSGSMALVFFLLLFLGPHFHFPEIAVLVMLIMSRVFTLDESLSSGGIRILLCSFALVLSVFQSSSRDFGVFPYERDAEGKAFRWTSQVASMGLPCIDGELRFQLRAGHTGLSENNPISVLLNVAGQTPREFRITDNALHSFALKCLPDSCLLSPSLIFPSKVPLRLEVSRGWRPSEHIAGSSDTRLLGLQLYSAIALR